MPDKWQSFSVIRIAKLLPVGMIGVSMKSDDSILAWIQKQAQPAKPKKPEPEPFSKIFTKTALDRGCTQEQIDKLLADIHQQHGQD